jgi:CIC family chloride channel protein
VTRRPAPLRSSAVRGIVARAVVARRQLAVATLARWRSHAAKLCRRPRLRPVLRYLALWSLRGALVGALSGALAITFYASLVAGTRLLLGALAGYRPARIAADGGFQAASSVGHPWLLPVVCGAAALLAAVLVFWVAPETSGHGTDAAIASIERNPRGIRARVTVVKILASAVTLGAGGSGGSEGPAAQVGAATGSALSRWLRLRDADARVLVAAGLGAAVAAVFRAPLAGALLGAELLYLRGIAVEVLVPALVAATVGYAEFGAVFGYQPMFGHLPAPVGGLSGLPLYLVLGVAAGLVGRLYIAVFYRTAAGVSRWRLPRPVRVGIGGVGTGLIALLVPGVLGTGYGTFQHLLDRDRILAMPLAVLLALSLAKIVATSLSIGSGGSGGVFGPGLLIGAGLGAGLWRLADLAGVAPAVPAAFVLLGAAACLGAAAHAPVAISVLAAEVVGDPRLLVPAVVVVGLAVAVLGDTTLYRSQRPAPEPMPAPEPIPAPEPTPVPELTPAPHPVPAAGPDGEAPAPAAAW